MSLSTYLEEVRLKAERAKDRITDNDIVIYRDIPKLLAIVEVQRKTLEKAANARPSQHLAHPQSVWWHEHIVTAAQDALAECERLVKK